MTGSSGISGEPKAAVHDAAPGDASYWAKKGTDLHVSYVPEGAINLNVEGRQVHGPIQGFGKMWQKTYSISLPHAEVTPEEIVKEWKDNFQTFWPEGNWFYGPLTGIAPGDVALLNLTMPGRVKLSTGVMVLYADDESFTFMSPEGHMFAALITFSASGSAGGPVAKVDILLRAGDPIYEVGLALGGHRKEDRFWEQTLRALAARFGGEGEFNKRVVCVDSKRQWRRFGNIKHSAALRSGAYMMGTPFRALTKPFKRKVTPL